MLAGAIANNDTAVLFDWLIDALSYQGISDEVAFNFMERNGRATWNVLNASLARSPSCPRLHDFWSFQGCGYNKTRRTCAEPGHINRCPLPQHRLRNGRLNVTAYSLYLFMRDIAVGNFVGWIDTQLEVAAQGDRTDDLASQRESLVGPLRQVHGISDKVLTMSLSMILMAAPRTKARWFEVGASMIAIDTLVHAFLWRTGILWRLEAQHRYGVSCYRANGCHDILQRIAQRIDARQFNPSYPRTFPRFVQHAVWQFCAALGHDQCNGNQIDDYAQCGNSNCQLYERCDRRRLHPLNALPLTDEITSTTEAIRAPANLKESDMTKKPAKQTKKATPAKKSPPPKPAKKSKPQVDLDMPIYVLVGKDDAGKPRAARFPNFNPEIISKAARVMGYWSSLTSYAETPEILKRLPMGKIYADSKALAPPISQDTYDLIVKAVGGELEKISPTLPRNREELMPGSLVVAQESAANGWYEAVVLERDGDTVKLRWRDFPQQTPVVRHLDLVALISQAPPPSE